MRSSRILLVTVRVIAALLLVSAGSAAPQASAEVLIPRVTTGLDGPEIANVQADLDAAAENPWPMLAANPQRTSWTPEEVSHGALPPEWYRPLEPYVNPKVQVIAALGLLYISTSAGLYALSADTGAVAWVYPTDMPLGHSPTVSGSTLYVGGYDRRIHAIAASPDPGTLPSRDGYRINDQVAWISEPAGGGYETNPLVVDGTLYAGNRDGNLYALDAATGALRWKYQTGGTISFSAAYAGGVIYIASNDGYAYALSTGGSLVWRSPQLPGAGFYSYWPVVYGDYLVLAGSPQYGFTTGLGVGQLNNFLDKTAVYPAGAARETYYGAVSTSVPGDWATGTVAIDASAVTQYLEQQPQRRTYFVLSRATGAEFTFDSDADGKAEYAPILWAGTHSGNRYPPVIGSDGVLYQQQSYLYDPYIPGGQVSGWKFGTPYISRVTWDWQAVDEPMAYSAGGSLIYWSTCNERESGALDLASPLSTSATPVREWKYYDYNLGTRMPGYDVMYWAPSRTVTGTEGYYGGPNGIYSPGGAQNPPIPYRGRVYRIAGNAVVAFGSRGGATALPIAKAVAAGSAGGAPSREAVRQSLVVEVTEMVAAGHLLPGYHNSGLADNTLGHDSNSYLSHYFHNPGETLDTLIRSLPFLPPGLQEQVGNYLKAEYQSFGRTTHIGWQQGTPRDGLQIPPEVQAKMEAFAPLETIYGSSWDWRYRVYALWKYAQVFPEEAPAILSGLSGRMQIVDPAQDNLQAASAGMAVSAAADAGAYEMHVPLVFQYRLPGSPPGTYAYHPYILNAYIAGYMGYLGLQALAGEPESSAMRAELDRLLALCAATFSEDSPYSSYPESGHISLNLSRSFIRMVPELADYMSVHARSRVEQALDEYDRVAPYWFVPGYDATMKEGGVHQLFDANALFQARARILQEPYAELSKYLDVAFFPTGDLYYIQNLVALLEAPD